MMKKNDYGTIYLKSGFHYTGLIKSIDSDWVTILDTLTAKLIQIRLESIDHFIINNQRSR